MGSIISLDLDGIELDYGKNAFWNNHAQLFQAHDYSLVYDENDNDVESLSPDARPGKYERSLKQTIMRLDLLGYSTEACRQYLKDHVARVFYDDVASESDNGGSSPLDAKWAIDVLISLRLDLIVAARSDYRAQAYTGSADAFRAIDHQRVWLAKIQQQLGLSTKSADRLGSMLRYFHLSVNDDNYSPDERCDPYVVLRLLGENPDNADRIVRWDHSALVYGGWASPAEFEPYLDPTNQVLVVTEGSSDAAVLKKALEQLRPDIVDFFYFVDMAENYPFTGTGNLFRFAQGLSRIRIQNKVVILYDNDAEGSFNYQRTLELKRPPHVGVLKLPTIDEFRNYPTIGPDGPGRSDINGRAVSIELFLQTSKDAYEPQVRWGSFHDKSQDYQGVVEGKDDLVKRFLAPSSHARDCPRLPALIDSLVSESTRLSTIA